MYVLSLYHEFALENLFDSVEIGNININLQDTAGGANRKHGASMEIEMHDIKDKNGSNKQRNSSDIESLETTDMSKAPNPAL